MSNGYCLALTALLASTVCGCSMGQTATYVRVERPPPQERVRLVRPAEAPIVAAWRQDGPTLIGQLAFAKVCQTEAVQLTRRARVSETRPNRNYVVGSYVAGSLLSAAGIAFMANSVGKSEETTCHDGECSSQASAWRALGMLTLASGVAAIIGGVFVKNANPRIEATQLPDEVRVVPLASAGDCGNAQALDGAVVRATLSSGGSWDGTADRNGVVRIELTGSAYARGAHASFSLTSIRPEATKLSLAGASLGQLELEPFRLRRAPRSKPTVFLSP